MKKNNNIQTLNGVKCCNLTYSRKAKNADFYLKSPHKDIRMAVIDYYIKLHYIAEREKLLLTDKEVITRNRSVSLHEIQEMITQMKKMFNLSMSHYHSRNIKAKAKELYFTEVRSRFISKKKKELKNIWNYNSETKTFNL